MFCAKCGSEAQEGAQFCKQCGSRIGEAPTSTTQAAESATESSGNTALILGIVGLALMFFISIVGLILCIIAIVTGNKERKTLPESKAGKATAGMVLGIIGLGVFAVSVAIAGLAIAAFL